MDVDALPPPPAPRGRDPEAPLLRIALVGCGKAKADHPAPAQDLYTGNLFRAARAHAEANYDAWWILSAKHNLLYPFEIVAPYDATMTDLTVEQKEMWGGRVDSGLRLHAGYGTWTQRSGRLEVDVFAGAAYVNALPHSWSTLSWTISTPLAGLQIGERLAWFADRRA